LRRAIQNILFLCCWLIPLQNAWATHLVGGELNYEHLGGDQYRVELKLYKDCGTSIVPFDDPALIYVYGDDDQFSFSFEIPIVHRDTLDAIFQDSCLFVPPEVCVDFARYETVINLPANADGYTLAFIRCCRTLAIRNAEGIDEFGNPIPPDLIGATYTAEIPGGVSNSNPEFRQFPPIIVCSGQDIIVDHSAVDPDGDQLVYSICTPYVGGSLTSVFGDPFVEMPPFEEIQWVEPYSLNDPLGAEPTLDVNPSTGMLTGKAPYTIGQFVVGVCVKEFRNGVLLSENKRDFQFNIADCGQLVTADYGLTGGISIDTVVVEDPAFEYILVCDSVPAVQFINMDDGADSVVWNFGDGSLPDLTADPYHVFPDTGFYLVSMYADPGQNCADTFSQLISIQFQDVAADFTFGLPECYDPGLGLQFTDVSEDTDAIDSWNWTFGNGATSSQQHPVQFYNPDGLYDVSLEVVSVNGCRSRKDTQINIIRLEEVMLEDTVALCRGDSVMLELQVNGEHTFEWMPDGGLNDAMAQSPIASPDESTTYAVNIYTQTIAGYTCLQRDSIHVLTTYPVPEIRDLTNPLQCLEEILLSAELSEGEEATWSNSPDFSEILSNEAEAVTTQNLETETYYLLVENAYCSSVDTIEVIQRSLVLRADDLGVCLGDDGLLELDVQSHDQSVIYTWSYPEPPYTTQEPSIMFTPEMSVDIGVLAVNVSGCRDSLEVFAEVYEPLAVNAMAEPTEVINSQSVQFDADEAFVTAYSWIPPENFNEPTIHDPTATVDETTTFFVDVTDMNGCVWRDSVTVTVLEIPCDDGSIFIPNAFSPNGDGLNDVFRLQGTVIESLTLEIFDRWGNPVFRANDINTSWDGYYKGQLLDNDVFGYVLTIDCFGGEDLIQKGSITLIR